jgi:hypothetical protein
LPESSRRASRKDVAAAALASAAWRRRRRGSRRVVAAASAKRKAGQAHHDEGRPPAVGVGHQPAERQAKQAAYRRAQHVDRDRRGALLLGHGVGDQRQGGWRAAGLADAHADARQHQVGEAVRRAAQRGEAAPQGDRGGDDQGPVAALGVAGDRDAEDGVEHRERQAGHHADLPVGQAEILLDGFGQDGDHLPVHEVQHVDQHQERQGVAAIGPAGERHRLRRGRKVVRGPRRHGHGQSSPRRCRPRLWNTL